MPNRLFSGLLDPELWGGDGQSMYDTSGPSTSGEATSIRQIEHLNAESTVLKASQGQEKGEEFNIRLFFQQEKYKLYGKGTYGKQYSGEVGIKNKIGRRDYC
uniref:Uncharacterized protein n=1 Tax=Glossina pallidipes TaxID=7398 RepID=A0A1A9ZM62_GLOPL